MTQDNVEHHVIVASTLFLLLFVGLTLFVASIAGQTCPDVAATSATFQTKCAMCHGPDGGGSEVGKSMSVTDLRSQAVQQLSDAELAQIISDGKGGMPTFKSSLGGAQIHALVGHIRSSQQRK